MKNINKHILISGAGVAGQVSAYWLKKLGFKVTMIERAESLRLGGQNIDFTDAARDVIKLMELDSAVLAKHTGELGLQFVDVNNHAKASFPTNAKGSLTREIEILRGDLVEILADASSSNIECIYGLHIINVNDRRDCVEVTFSDNSKQNFDFVICADGMNSTTRDLIIDKGDHKRYLGCWSSYFTVPRIASDNDWWRWYTSPTGVIAFLRPDNKGTMRACVNFLDDNSEAIHMPVEEKRRILTERLRGAGWQCERLTKALSKTDDIFLGPLHQIKAKTWSRGRCVLVGDAAHCPTPYTGQGTTLAIIGSYLLANELASHEDHRKAFSKYEEIFRPFVESAQKLPPGVPNLAYARSKFKVGLINTCAAIGASSAIQTMASFFGDDNKEKINLFDLPDYKN